MKTRHGFTLIELLVVLVILAILCSLIIGGCGLISGSHSVGSRSGVVQKFSKKGQLGTPKTYEGELALSVIPDE